MHSIKQKINRHFIFKNYTIKVIFYALCFSLAIALIHEVLTLNVVQAIVGLTLSFAGAFLLFYKNKLNKKEVKFIAADKITETSEDRINYHTNNTYYNREIRTEYFRENSIQPIEKRIVDIDNAPYNENINGDFIGRDSVANTKNITFGRREVEINSNDIIETIGELKDVLTKSIEQSSDLFEAISIFKEELIKAFRDNPELKTCFNVEKDTNEDDLVNSIVKFLLTHDYSQIENMNFDKGVSSTTLIRYKNNSEVHFREFITYKDYNIELLQGNHDRWIYKIQRSDNTFIENDERGGSYKKENAIKKAEKEINKELTSNFHSK